MTNFIEGFYYGNLVHNHFNDGLYHQDCTFAGVALEDSKDGKVLIEQRNFFKKGDQLELVTPLSLGTAFTVEGIETEEDIEDGRVLPNVDMPESSELEAAANGEGYNFSYYPETSEKDNATVITPIPPT
mgnify:CR=1 FL=1